MLSVKDRRLLSEALQAEKQRLLKSAQEALAFARNRERNIGRDPIDDSTEEELFSTELRLRDREKFLLTKILGAIARLEANTINECEDCGEAIGAKRLLARPVTTLCIGCKEERERAEKATSEVGRGGAGADHDTAGDEPGGEEI